MYNTLPFFMTLARHLFLFIVLLFLITPMSTSFHKCKQSMWVEDIWWDLYKKKTSNGNSQCLIVLWVISMNSKDTLICKLREKLGDDGRHDLHSGRLHCTQNPDTEILHKGGGLEHRESSIWEGTREWHFIFLDSHLHCFRSGFQCISSGPL